MGGQINQAGMGWQMQHPCHGIPKFLLEAQPMASQMEGQLDCDQTDRAKEEKKDQLD